MMFKKTLSAMLSAGVLAVTGTMMPADALDTQPKEMTEEEALANVCAELGIEDFDAYLAKLEARLRSGADRKNSGDTCPYDPEYFIDIYTGGDSNGRIDAKDANYLVQFLNGQVNYPYDYADLDPTHDYIVDRADVDALLECYSAVCIIEVYPDFVPGTHGATRTINTTFENRSYTKYDFSTGQTSSYTLKYNQLNSTNEPIASVFNQPKSVSSSNTTRSITYDNDTRIVRTSRRIVNNGVVSHTYSGSGFIIGKHLIATAAHCVYNSSTGISPNREVFGLSFSDDPSTGGYNTTLHQLSIKSIHVPTEFIQNEEQRSKYDYALIVVNDDLSNYGMFDLGMLLDDNPNGYTVNHAHTITTKGLADSSHNEQIVEGNLCYAMRGDSLDSTGLQSDLYWYYAKNQAVGGTSGGASYLSAENGYNDTAIGVHTAIAGSTMRLGAIISRPLLQFYLNNSNY